MRAIRTWGSVRGVLGNWHPYRDQRWEATGAPNSGLAGPGGIALPVCGFPAGNKAVNPKGLGTGPHINRLLFVFNEWRLILELARPFWCANCVAHTSTDGRDARDGQAWN